MGGKPFRVLLYVCVCFEVGNYHVAPLDMVLCVLATLCYITLTPDGIDSGRFSLLKRNANEAFI